MPAYVTLVKYTGPVKGGGPERFEKVKQIVAEEKGEILHLWGLLGAYDVIFVSEFPDNRAALKAAARVGNCSQSGQPGQCSNPYNGGCRAR
jgi:uncharacterized protein with GYD domain